MAETIITRTRKLTRDKLAKFLPNHEAIKVFEDLTHDVVITLPDAIGDAAVDTGQVLAGSSFSRQIQQPSPPDDTASQILATQIFGA